ncbi:MAG: cache domain-containing protein [Lachnospiraceae bacterium]|nr:cache domain-containing protein [Lachnospiraceae bacterium]
MKNSKFNMRKMLMLFALIPLVLCIIVLTVFSVLYMKSKLAEETKNTLRVAAMDLYEYYSYDIVNETNLVDGWVSYDTEYMDHLQYADVELTLFKGDTRFCTSIIGSDGKRIEGTKASDAVIAEVINKGNEFFSDDVVINGKDYFVYYVPIRDAKGNVVGMAFAGKTCENFQSTVNAMMMVFIAIAVVMIIVFSVICALVSNVVANPLKQCAEAMGKLADGDLKAENNASSIVDETKSLIFASHTLRDKLSDILGNVKEVSTQLNSDANNVQNLSETASTSVSQISSAMEDLAEGATEMASNVQDIAKSVTDMTETVTMLSESSEALTASSENIKRANDDASEYISRVSASSVQTVEAVQNITKQISDTNDAVQKIKEAVDMITSIASQTNLLALNASIEAARAGEAGRGFAVVASEIGNLSDQSSQSANEIRKIVDEIVRNSEASVELSGNVAHLINEEQEYIRDTQAKFETLGSEIGDSLSRIRQVGDDAIKLEKIQSVITDAVQSLSAISEENAASNEEVSASITGIAASVEEIASNADETRNNSEKLVQVVSYFN